MIESPPQLAAGNLRSVKKKTFECARCRIHAGFIKGKSPEGFLPGDFHRPRVISIRLGLTFLFILLGEEKIPEPNSEEQINKNNPPAQPVQPACKLDFQRDKKREAVVNE